MRTFALVLACAALVGLAGTCGICAPYVDTFESCTPGTLAGQSGWFLYGGSSHAQAYADNGPSQPGSVCARLDNAAGDGIILYKQIGNQVGTNRILTLQYDIRNVTNHTSVFPTTIRVRIDDNSSGWQYMPPIDNFHYDGGGGPACQARVSDGNNKNIWASGGPAWQDTGWHTVAWRMNYQTRQFTGVRFDGKEYPQFNYYFTYWPGYPTAATTLELNLTGPDGNNDIWEVDNIVVTTEPVPQPIPIATAKGLADGEMVDIKGAMTATFAYDSPPRFYVQEPGSVTGIQVRCVGDFPTSYACAAFSGQMATDWMNHERFIQMPGYWNTTTTASFRPLVMNARELGGGLCGLQEAVREGSGLNNVGSLVKCYGKVVEKHPDGNWFYIQDGSKLDDGTATWGLRVDCTAIATGSRPNPAIGSYVSVTGISSLYKLNDAYHRLVRIRSSADLSALANAP